jgi:hypothetical protein
MRGTGCEMDDTGRVQEFLESEVKSKISKESCEMSVHEMILW